MNPYQNSFGGNIPQDVAGKQGENVIFIVYTLKDTPETLDKVKDVCANFSAMIRSMRNRFPELMFSCTMGFGADCSRNSKIWVRMKNSTMNMRKTLTMMISTMNTKKRIGRKNDFNHKR